MFRSLIRYFSLPEQFADEHTERHVRQLHPMLIVGVLAAFTFPILSYLQDARWSGLVVGLISFCSLLVLFHFLRQGRVKLVAGVIVLVGNVAAIWRLATISGIQHALVTILMVLLVVTRIFMGQRPLWLLSAFNSVMLFVIYTLQRSGALVGEIPLPRFDALILYFVSFFTLTYYLNITVGSLETYANASRRQSASLKRSQAELLDVKEHLEEIVTERTAALSEKNQELKVAKESAEAANRSKSAFLANMSHELRTPLHTILGYSAMLQEQLIDQENLSAQDLEQIEMAGNHLLELINEILDLSKVEANISQRVLSQFYLAELLEEIEYQLRPHFSETSNTFQLEVEDPLVLLHSDRTKIKQILFNLLNNSLKFTENGTVTLRVTQQPTPAGEAGLCFAVIDTGIGISANHLDKLFTPFYQVDNSYKRRYKGTGLGLTLCHRFAQLLDGTVEVESQLGHGSTFRVFLPHTLQPVAEPSV